MSYSYYRPPLHSLLPAIHASGPRQPGLMPPLARRSAAGSRPNRSDHRAAPIENRSSRKIAANRDFPPLHHILIALVIHLLEYEQPHHQPHRLGWTSFLAVILPKASSKSAQGIRSPSFLKGCRGSHCSLSVGIKNEDCVLGFRFVNICAFRPGSGSKPSFHGRYPLTFSTRRPACLLAPLTFSGTTNLFR